MIHCKKEQEIATKEEKERETDRQTDNAETDINILAYCKRPL